MWDKLVSWDNLWLAYRKAAKGKRGQAPVARFEYQLADHLLELQDELITFRYQPGPYVHFMIHEPKRRKISAAPFRDRVVHHALCNIIEPLFEQQFIIDSYANRIGKGTHRAIDQFQAFARRYRYVLRADIVKHFPSLDHAVLRTELARVIDDDRVLWLVDRILDSGAGILADEYAMVYFPGDDLLAIERPRGLPIGNLTSQFWSNCYMNTFDWFIKRELGCKVYLRYVDDFALFSNSKRELMRWKNSLIQQLSYARLTIHEAAAQATPTARGVSWLGFVVYPDHRLVKQRKIHYFRYHLTQLVAKYRLGQVPFIHLNQIVQGWINHVRYGDTWRLRQHILRSLW